MEIFINRKRIVLFFYWASFAIEKLLAIAKLGHDD